MDNSFGAGLLDQVRIATPCDVRWDDMTGDDRVRHCARCDLNVHNLSAMTSTEAEVLLAGRTGRLCVFLYRRPDGTIITQDCPVGLRAARQRLFRSIRNMAAMILGLSGVAAGCRSAAVPAAGGLAEPPGYWGDSALMRDERSPQDTARRDTPAPPADTGRVR